MTAISPGQPGIRAAVAIVVLNHNGRELLLQCLQCIEAVDYRPLSTVVVDNGSTDGSVEEVRRLHPGIHLIPVGYNAGVSGGRNAGVRYVEEHLRAEYILFLDNDTRIEPDAVREFVAAADRDARIGLVAPKAFRKKGDSRLLSAGGMGFNPYTGALRDVAGGDIDRGQHDQPRDVQAGPGFAFLVRSAVFRTIGLFDETFNPYGWEDVDISLRAGKAGFRIVYAPKAVVYHAGGRVGRGVIRHYERNKARNMLYFVRRHTTIPQWTCFLCAFPFLAFGRVAKEVLSGNGRVVLEWVKSMRGAK
jgi:GT2 family glycosyltransferase